MVPFAEVVLLTAMEYHREDDSHGGQDGNMSVDFNDEEEDEPNAKGCQNCWVPRLTTIGDISDF